MVGQLVRVEAPIDGGSERRIRTMVRRFIDDAQRQNRWPIVIFEFESGRNDFGKALDLARFLSGPQLNGATSVAYVPESITGHSVLAILACDEIVMHPDAKLGDAGKDEDVISPMLLNGYTEVANSRRTVPVDLAIGMLNRDVEVVAAETETGREFVLASELPQLAEKRAVLSTEVIKPAGEPAIFSGREGRELGFVTYLAEDHAAVARALGLPRNAMEVDPSAGGEWRAVRVNVQGPITARASEQVQRIVQEQLRSNNVNFVCVWIESPGGSPRDSINLANFLADLDPKRCRTVAYIPTEAGADAAFIALACDHVVMRPDATLGGWRATEISPDDVNVYVVPLREIALRKSRSPSLAAAFVDPQSSVFRFVRQNDGLVEYLTPEDAEALEQRDEWRQEAEITTPGEPLELTGVEAEEVGLARNVVETFDEFKDLYGLAADPALVEPGWVDSLVSALRSPGVASLLVMVGLAALYLEFQTPGLGLGGFIASVAFVLYFWSNYLGGTVEWLEILLFTLGLTCILIELFILPGMGIFGFGGGVLVLLSLVMAGQSFVLPRDASQMGELRGSLLVVSTGIVGFLVMAVAMRRFLPHTPGLNRMLLAPPSGSELAMLSERESTAHYQHLLGTRGRTVTRLAPSGKARFGDEMVDVIAEGGSIIDRDSEVVVIEARGNRVVVRGAT